MARKEKMNKHRAKKNINARFLYLLIRYDTEHSIYSSFNTPFWLHVIRREGVLY